MNAQNKGQASEPNPAHSHVIHPTPLPSIVSGQQGSLTPGFWTSAFDESGAFDDLRHLVSQPEHSSDLVVVFRKEGRDRISRCTELEEAEFDRGRAW